MSEDRAFARAPSAVAFMLRAVAGGLVARRTAAPSSASWTSPRVDARHAATFGALTGLDASSILYPQVLSFRLQMAVLTSPRFPRPIWRALQVRVAMAARRAWRADAPLRFDVRATTPRPVDKGEEIDLVTTLRSEGDVAWEGTTTFLYRRRVAGVAGVAPAAPRAPDVRGVRVDAWTTPARDRWAFGRLTGDFNGLHLWDSYARAMGFPRAFAHPPRVAGACLARLRLPRGAQRLELWWKGPVPYGHDVQLTAERAPGRVAFGLAPARAPRPLIVGVWTDGL